MHAANLTREPGRRRFALYAQPLVDGIPDSLGRKLDAENLEKLRPEVSRRDMRLRRAGRIVPGHAVRSERLINVPVRQSCSVTRLANPCGNAENQLATLRHVLGIAAPVDRL